MGGEIWVRWWGALFYYCVNYHETNKNKIRIRPNPPTNNKINLCIFWGPEITFQRLFKNIQRHLKLSYTVWTSWIISNAGYKCPIMAVFFATNWLQWFFSLYTSEKKSNSADRAGIVLLRHSFECVALWVTAEVLRLRSRNSCELHSFINKSQPTVGSFECDGHPCRHLMAARQRLLCFFCSMLFFSRSLSPTQSRWVPCSARLENFVIRELLKCVAWVQSAVAHTHTAQEPVLYFITLLLYSPILFSCTFDFKVT